MDKLKPYALVILRLGMTAVFIWFGLTQLLNQGAWVGFIPHGIVSATGISAETFVIINGIFEIIMSILLAFGIGVRVVGFLLAIHMLAIVADVGLSPIGVRDIGILIGLITLTLNGGDHLCWNGSSTTQAS